MTYEEKVWDTFIRAMKGDLKAQAEILYVDAMLNGDNRLIKEETKMLNFDKYRKEIDDYITTEKDLGGIDCKIATLRRIRNCEDYECDVCMRESLRWLFSEYEPPMLENGDGLKPGDWLEIEDDNDGRWYKGRFIGYLYGRFYVKHEGDQHLFGVSSSVHARLLEDGE